MTSIRRKLLASAAFLVLVESSPSDQQPAYAQVAERGSVEGVLTVLWGDPGPGVSEDARIIYTLVDDAGRSIDLQLDPGLLGPLGGLTGVNRRRVQVTGEWVSSPAADEPAPALRVSSLEVDGASGEDLTAPAVLGSQPWVNVLCRFGDMTAVTPKPQSYYDGLMGSTAPGLNHYWRETSYEQINIAGTVVTQW